MKKIQIASIIILVFMSAGLVGCRTRFLTADTLPWVRSDPLFFKDGFSFESGVWQTHEDKLSFSGYQDEKYRLWVDVPYYQYISVPGLNFRNVKVFTSVEKQSGPDNNLFGLLCRYQDNLNYYAFVVGSDGYYGIYRVVDGEKTLIGQQHLDFSEYINRGNQVNDLMAICQEDQLVLLVNGVRLIQVQDDSLAFGDVGLIAGNFSEPGVDILFDNFIVAKP